MTLEEEGTMSQSKGWQTADYFRKYLLAWASDPNFDAPHPVAKSYDDGSPIGHCRCGKPIGHTIHDVPLSDGPRPAEPSQPRIITTLGARIACPVCESRNILPIYGKRMQCQACKKIFG